MCCYSHSLFSLSACTNKGRAAANQIETPTKTSEKLKEKQRNEIQSAAECRCCVLCKKSVSSRFKSVRCINKRKRQQRKNSKRF